MFKARQLKSVLDQITAVNDLESEPLWAEALRLINHFVRKGLKQSRAKADEIDDAQAEFLLTLVASREGIVDKLQEIPTKGIASYIRVAAINALVRLRQRNHHQPLQTLPIEIGRNLGRPIEPDELQRALNILAGCDLESRFILRALMLGYDMPEIIEAVGGPSSRMRLYRKREEVISKMQAAIREDDGQDEEPVRASVLR